jgi:Cu-Zn family superoxide dismutase
MKTRVRISLAAIAAVVSAAGGVGVAGPAAAGGSPATGTIVYRLSPSTHGNPEGVAWAPNSDTFFVGATGDGTIYRGSLHNTRVHVYIAGAQGRSAVGMKVFNGKLYVAGGSTGQITVYRVATGRVIASFDTGAGGFLNDLTVTDDGHVYVTDSFRPTLWHLTPAQVRAGAGRPDGIPVEPQIAYKAGAFNLNGIVSLAGGRELIVVHSTSGRLYRIVLDRSAPHGRRISVIDAPALVGGDGLLLDRGQLFVVTGNPARLTFLNLNAQHTRATVDHRRTDPSLRGPSTVAAANGRYLVVNADFASSTTPFTVSGLRRG